MRNMSFSLTTPQMLARTKTVTRRLGWEFLKPGDVMMAIEKGQGLKRGEHVTRLYPIEVISVRREQVNEIDAVDVIREGFPEFSVDEFIEMFCEANGCKPTTRISRIEFREVMQ